MTMSEQVSALGPLGLSHAPVAIGFLDAPPSDLVRITRSDAASCGYWKQASEGRSFYTTAADHENCPVGAYTHGVELPAAKQAELQGLMGTMIELKYLDSAEIPGIPHRTQPFGVAAYAPLAQATFTPDVVVFRGNARQIMLITEAARRAKAFDDSTIMGRPACSMLPQTAVTGTGVASVGCIGNRVYTGLADDELYLAVPGSAVDRVLAEIGTILNANQQLEAFHRARKADLAG